MMRSLYQPIDAAILVYFRIVAGVLMAQELINGIIIGKFHEYTKPVFHFSYLYFDWIRPWPYWGMVVHFALTILAAFAVAFNIHYKFFSKILFLGYTSIFLMEQSEYINHNYLYCLISFWMMFLPLNKNKTSQPAWMLYLILFHMALAYFFGGIAKLNSDWLNGTPMDLFLAYRKDYPLGFLYTSKWAPYLFSYGGLLFDLLIIPMMLFRPTRLAGLVCSIMFHISNILMFGLATFPWFSMLLTSMFFDPSWPRKIPILKNFMPWGVEKVSEFKPNRLLVTCLSIYAIIHLSLPFRHHFYPGVTSWTEEGHMFAWRMMLRTKHGQLHLYVQNKKTGHMHVVNHKEFITDRQYKDMVGKPDLILQFSHFLRDHFKKTWNTDVAVFASSRVSLNGRPKVELIRPGTDLAREERKLTSYEWINPLSESLVNRDLSNVLQ